jgi:hypothetical protein
MKIISGAQTGADQGGLWAAKALRLPTGGYCTKNCRTEKGDRRDLVKEFNLTELETTDYPTRTWKNVELGDITLIFGDLTEPGSKLTKEYCKTLMRPCYHIPFGKSKAEEFIKHIIQTHRPGIINIAGNRESKSPGIQNWTREILKLALKEKGE